MQDGSKKQIGLGAHPLTTLKMARETAFANAQAVRAAQAGMPSTRILETLTMPQPQPVTPTTQVVEVAAYAPTFQEVAEQTIEALIGTWKDVSGVQGKNNSTEKFWRGQLQNFAYPKIGNLPVNKIESSDIVRVLRPIWTKQYPTAHQLKMKLATVFDHAIADNWVDINPVSRAEKALPRVKHQKIPRLALRYQDIPSAIEKIQSADARYPATPNGLMFMILTATRRNETRAAKWDEIDFENRTWTVPASRMKSGREHRIPLSQQAIDILHSIERTSDYVFANANGKPLSEGTYLGFLKRHEIESSVHGFRSAFRTWSEECTTASHSAKEAALAHTLGSKIETPYMRTDMIQERHGLMQAWADFILGDSVDK